MKLSPPIRVIISNAFVIAAIGAVWFGYGPLAVIPAIAAHVYLHRVMMPRIPEFTARGHSFLLCVAWYSLVISLAVVYFATTSNFMTPRSMRIYVCTAVPLLLLGCFFDDVRYARKVQRESRSRSLDAGPNDVTGS
jgi:hypothetical protein